MSEYYKKIFILIEDFEKKNISLKQLAKELRIAINSQKEIDPKWRERIFEYWEDLEEINAVLLDKEETGEPLDDYWDSEGKIRKVIDGMKIVLKEKM